MSQKPSWNWVSRKFDGIDFNKQIGIGGLIIMVQLSTVSQTQTPMENYGVITGIQIIWVS